MKKEGHPVANNTVHRGHGAGGGDPHPQRPERLQLLGQLPVQRLDPLIQLSDRGALQGPGAWKLGDSSSWRALQGRRSGVQKRARTCWRSDS